MIEHVYRRAAGGGVDRVGDRGDRRRAHPSRGAGLRRRVADDVGVASERNGSHRGDRRGPPVRSDRQRPGRRAAHRARHDRRGGRAVCRRPAADDEHAAHAASTIRPTSANPNVTKVVVDRDGFALYFSRAPIPFVRQGCPPAPAWRHIGLYVYRRECLLRLAALPPTAMEQAEALEQLRALEHGIRIKTVETTFDFDRRRHAGGSGTGTTDLRRAWRRSRDGWRPASAGVPGARSARAGVEAGPGRGARQRAAGITLHQYERATVRSAASAITRERDRADAAANRVQGATPGPDGP